MNVTLGGLTHRRWTRNSMGGKTACQIRFIWNGIPGHWDPSAATDARTTDEEITCMACIVSTGASCSTP